MLLIALFVLFFLALGGGSWGYSRYGYASWSPVGLVLAVILVFWLTGTLHG